ncbi:disks large-associated protein 1 isoform X2 [Drosophila bipectinata]|uniref:disks large-associated protein 1 isoform X2 n=2 Tax=Drosophila bipectinata TaxID=42026 RepID=UPI001C8981DF|nr:disks large-associated protein 1 isoform X2 [Drosophila bipectinata]
MTNQKKNLIERENSYANIAIRSVFKSSLLFLQLKNKRQKVLTCSLALGVQSASAHTSGSLNFPTPISVRDITEEFTNNLKERCTPRLPQQPQHTYSALLDPRAGVVRMVLSPATVESGSGSNAASVNVAGVCANNSLEAVTASDEKKPSYLNLACSVNGYSNLTTYDSKIRQDINKSREVSPIRPSTSSLQYCKRNSSLTAPVLHSMPLIKLPSPTSQYSATGSNKNSNGNGIEHGTRSGHPNGNEGAHCEAPKSFIKQRVERLYGPGALAQGFYSPKKSGHFSSQSATRIANQKLEIESSQDSELARKFKQLSPSKDYGEFRKKLPNNCSQSGTVRSTESSDSYEQNVDVELPVFRHLSYEFRSQLPTVSPKRATHRSISALKLQPANESPEIATQEDVVDHEPLKPVQMISEEYDSTTKIILPTSSKDGNYFLKILKDEQARLLALAALAEKYLDALVNNPDISEDTFGLLRSASGKARLLVSQKMKQFEGLCHNNLNRSPEDEFPTTVDDLQGFWDMVYLQVTHVDNIFAGIEQLKANDWKSTIQSQMKETPIKKIKSAKPGALKTKNAATSNTITGSKLAPANTAAALKREAQRQQLLEMKRQRREAMAAAAKLTETVSDAAIELSDTIGDSSSKIKNIS